MLELDSAIQHLKESLADHTHEWGCEECKAEHEQLLEWLEDYEQLKADYIDIDKQLRTANTEIDRLQSVSSWTPCSERMPEDYANVLAYNYGDGVLIANYSHCLREWMETFECYPLTNVTHWMPLPSMEGLNGT